MIPRTAAVRAVLPIALLMSMAPPLAGQRTSGEPVVPRARMRDFVRALLEDGDRIGPYFPRRGSWTWIATTRYPSGRETVERREFPGGGTPVTVEFDGRNCATLHGGGDSIDILPLVHDMRMDTAEWRRVGGNRFVPPGGRARSRTYVQWRRESGRWVVAAIGEEREGWPRLLGIPRNSVIRDTTPHAPLVLPLPANELYAGGMRWYVENERIEVDGRFVERYGLPQPIASGEVTRIGTLNGVAVFMETGAPPPTEVLYVPVDAHGSFQSYLNMTGGGCR